MFLIVQGLQKVPTYDVNNVRDDNQNTHPLSESTTIISANSMSLRI